MAKLEWDKTGERRYETGIEQGALYVQTASGYGVGEAWNGLISVTESPSGAEASPLYANNIKYLNLISAEEFGFSIEAYMYPDGFAECNGEKEAAKGLMVTQQARKGFGMVYKSLIGNDTEGTALGYTLHLVYGATAAPSEKARTTVNDSPEAMILSWECTTTPVSVNGMKPTAHLIIDSTKADAAKLAALEAILYGSDDVEARLPLPDEVVTLMSESSAG